MAVIDTQLMKETMRLWASGVSIVTSAHNGAHAGMTVSAFNSLSVEPPLVLVCLQRDTHTAQMIVQSGVFGVSFLGRGHADLSDRFAGRIALPTHEARFEGVETVTAETGVPLLADAIGWVDCKVVSRHDGATHDIVIGQVQAAHALNGADPLLYFNRAYHALSAETVLP